MGVGSGNECRRRSPSHLRQLLGRCPVTVELQQSVSDDLWAVTGTGVPVLAGRRHTIKLREIALDVRADVQLCPFPENLAVRK